MAQGGGVDYTNPPTDLVDHALGRSRGGLNSKIHVLVDGRGLPLSVLQPQARPGTTHS